MASTKPANQLLPKASALYRAESSRGGGFASGFVVGGVVFGTLGFLFAPQVIRNPNISSAYLFKFHTIVPCSIAKLGLFVCVDAYLVP